MEGATIPPRTNRGGMVQTLVFAHVTAIQIGGDRGAQSKFRRHRQIDQVRAVWLAVDECHFVTVRRRDETQARTTVECPSVSDIWTLAPSFTPIMPVFEITNRLYFFDWWCDVEAQYFRSKIRWTHHFFNIHAVFRGIRTGAGRVRIRYANVRCKHRGRRGKQC